MGLVTRAAQGFKLIFTGLYIDRFIFDLTPSYTENHRSKMELGHYWENKKKIIDGHVQSR